MTVLCRAYTSHEQARRAVDALLGAGVPGADVHVLMGEPERDAREAPEGEFAGTVGPDAPVGDFAGGQHRRAEGAGAFAGAAEEQRRGSFADADREIVASYPEGVEHMRVAGHHKVRKLLTDAGLDETAAERDVEALHAGRILVLADVGSRDPAEVTPLLDDATRE